MNQELFYQWVEEEHKKDEEIINTYFQDELYVEVMKIDDKYCEKFYEQDKVFPNCFKLKDHRYFTDEETDIMISFQQERNSETVGPFMADEAIAYLDSLDAKSIDN